MDSQNQVYECSRKNASIQISNSEWVNEWNDGIKLNKGDTVRLLGSFISEVGDGNDISISEDTKFTVNFKPYLNAETVRFGQITDHSIAGAFQMKLGDIAQPAYYTDNFGTEPPYTTQELKAQGTILTTASNKRLVADRFEYNIGINGATAFNYGTDDAVKAGAFMDTSSGALQITAAQVTNEDLVNGTLSVFNQLNVPHEYHIAHLCKLVKLPLFAGVRFSQTFGAPVTEKLFDSNDIFKVGDYISTYHVANYPTVVGTNPNTPADYQVKADTTFGDVKWEAGPQSVVGKIVATKFAYEMIYDPVTDQNYPMEYQLCYVQDFINPGQYKHQNDIDGNTGGRPPRHGASELENGYNTFRNNNRLNGFSYAENRGGDFVSPGNASTVADVGENYANMCNQYNINGNEELNGTVTQNQSMKNNTNAGLSFLWGAKGSSNLNNYNIQSGGQAYNQEACTSWISPEVAVSGVWTQLTNGTNMTQINVGENTFTIGCDDDFQTLRTQTMNVGSFFGGPAGNPYFSSILNMEEVPYQPGFFAQRNHYYSITTFFTAAAQIAPGALDIHFQRNEGGLFYNPLCFLYEYGEESGSGNIQLTNVNSGDWKDLGGIVTMNPNNDNQPYEEPATPGTVKRWSVPYNQQKVKSPYTTRNYGFGGAYVDPVEYAAVFAGPGANGIFNGQTNITRLRHIFGTSPGFRGEGDLRQAANRAQPFPYGLGTMTPPYREYFANAYNEQCLSVYFQNDEGDTHYQQPVDNNDIVQNKLWHQDLVYIKTYKTEFNIPAGFYSPERMADIINDQLHFDTNEYFEKVGNVTNVGSRERARTDGNNVIHGNFIHTYIPELSYGFLPMTPEAYGNLNNPENFNIITHNVNDFFSSFGLNNQNPQNVSASNGYDYYTVPYTHDNGNASLPQNNSLYMFRLIGSRILQEQAGNDMQHINPSILYNNRNHDVLATSFRFVSGTPAPFMYWYQNRTYKNKLMYGGAAKCWIGAVNPTFEFDPETELFNFSFLYTPYRPAADESGSVLTLTGGEAVPSAIVNTIGSGELTESLSGVYIESLTAERIAAGNSPQFFDLFNSGYPPALPDYATKSRNLWNVLGFSNSLLNSYQLNVSASNPYLFLTSNLINGNVLRNQAEVDISANGSNPLKSYCNIWCPPVQYAVIVESNRKYGDSKPKFGNTPFYLIGSSFPTNEYYGGKGTKLPIIGICSRQFSSFGFAFDLSESAVTLTIDQDCTITSIKTKIYNNDFSVPDNLDDNSSVIYVIERNNYYPTPTQQELEAADKEIIAQNQPETYTPQMFSYMAPINYQAPLYLIDSDDEDLE